MNLASWQEVWKRYKISLLANEGEAGTGYGGCFHALSQLADRISGCPLECLSAWLHGSEAFLKKLLLLLICFCTTVLTPYKLISFCKNFNLSMIWFSQKAIQIYSTLIFNRNFSGSFLIEIKSFFSIRVPMTY
jgi:hypothetical protein